MVYKKVYEKPEGRREEIGGGERNQEEDGNNVTHLC